MQILSDLLGESSMVMMALEGIERVLSVGDLRVVRNAIASHSHADKVGSVEPLSRLLGREPPIFSTGVVDESLAECTSTVSLCQLQLIIGSSWAMATQCSRSPHTSCMS